MRRPRAQDDETRRPATRPAVQRRRATKHSVSMDAETWRRLGRLAVDLETDRSALLTEWARERLDRYERAGRDLSPAPGVPTVGVVFPPSASA